MKELIVIVSKGNQTVQVMKVEGMKGYEFDAVGRESLSLAAELAVLQTQEPWRLKEIIDEIANR